MERIEDVQTDEISLKDLIHKIHRLYKEILKGWLLIALSCLFFVSILLYRSFTIPVIYKAELTYMLNEDSGGTGIGSLLGNIGGLIGGQGNTINLEKMVELSKTRAILDPIIFGKIERRGKLDYVANHIIELYDLHDTWNKSKNEAFHNFLFKNSDLEGFNRIGNKAYLDVYKIIVKKLISGKLEEIGIVTLEAKTRDEKLSLFLVNELFDRLSTFYLDKSIEKQLATYENAKSKTDSIASLLVNAEYELARFQQKNRNLRLETEMLKGQRLNRAVIRLGAIYVEALKISEQTKFSLDSATPFVQVIDRPIAPLMKIKNSKLVAIILGLFLGCLIGGGIVIFRGVLRDALAT